MSRGPSVTLTWRLEVERCCTLLAGPGDQARIGCSYQVSMSHIASLSTSSTAASHFPSGEKEMSSCCQRGPS